MKGKAIVAGIVAVAGLAIASSALADVFDAKLQASKFNSKLVQAFDECMAGITTLAGVDACAPGNVDTAPNRLFNLGKLIVKSKATASQVMGILKSSGTADLPKKQLANKVMHVRLTLRISKRTQAVAPFEPATWVDQTLDCANVTASSSGNWVYKGQLDVAQGGGGCGLNANISSTSYQKEIVSAAIIDNTTGNPIAVPGVRKRP